MFNNLFNFEYKRSPLEALGFYIAYFVLFIALAFLVGLLMGMTGLMEADQTFTVGVIMASLVAFGLSTAIVVKKKLWGNFLLVLLVPVAGILAAFGGMLFGGIVPAYLSTK
jgi:hypothetical protein